MSFHHVRDLRLMSLENGSSPVRSAVAPGFFYSINYSISCPLSLCQMQKHAQTSQISQAHKRCNRVLFKLCYEEMASAISMIPGLKNKIRLLNSCQMLLPMRSGGPCSLLKKKKRRSASLREEFKIQQHQTSILTTSSLCSNTSNSWGIFFLSNIGLYHYQVIPKDVELHCCTGLKQIIRILVLNVN